MRTTWTKCLVPLLLAVALAACGGSSSEPPADPQPVPEPAPFWDFPKCEAVTGVPVATYSPDQGVTVRPNDPPVIVDPNAITQSVVAPNLAFGRGVYASRGLEVFASTDLGCTWNAIFEAPEPLTLTEHPNSGGVVGIGPSGNRMFVFEHDQVSTVELDFHARQLNLGTHGLVALTTDGRILLSTDELDTWEQVAEVPIDGREPRSMSVHQRMFSGMETLVVTFSTGLPLVSVDGGASWAVASGIEAGADEVRTGFVWPTSRFFEVWLFVERVFGGDRERVIARSTDHGLSFTDVIVDDGDTVLLDDVPMIRLQEVLIFPGGGCPDAEPRLYHYRPDDSTLTVVTWDEGTLYGIASLYLHPFFPDYLHIGHRAIDTCD